MPNNHPKKYKVLCYIVTYNAAPFIEGVLKAIPEVCWSNERYAFDVLISDDCSSDDTFLICRRTIAPSSQPIRVQRMKHNIGYGGNQKIGYDYAVRQGYDAVVLLHGDGQYDPHCIPDLLEPLLAGKADVVLGSRMKHKKDALKGRMPLYKFGGNIILTAFQNYVAGTALSEFHTGFRAYATKALASIPYRYNSDGYVFDTEILLQHIGAGHTIFDIPIPTHYGKEICHVNGLKYAWRVIMATLGYKMHRLGFYYLRQYDVGNGEYPSKTAFDSSHRFAIDHTPPSTYVVDIGNDNGNVASVLRQQGNLVHGFSVGSATSKTLEHYDRYTQLDREENVDFSMINCKPDIVLLLDILEHLKKPDIVLFHLRDIIDADTRVIITVPNVAFFMVRLKLLFGFFSYTSRGILDHSHLRFFTFRSMKALLQQQGYDVMLTRGIPPPFPLVIKSKILGTGLLKLGSALISLHKGLFSFQIGIVAKSRIISHDS